MEIDRIAITVCKRVVAQQALASRSKCVRIVVSGLEVIVAVLCIEEVASVAQRIEGAQRCALGTGGGKKITPGVVMVLHHHDLGAVQNADDIALDVGDVVVYRAVMIQRQGRSRSVVGEVQHIAAYRHLTELVAVIDIAVGLGAVGTLGSQTVGIVGKIPGSTAVGHGSQLSAVLPGIGPGAVGEGIADAVVGDGLPVILHINIIYI